MTQQDFRVEVGIGGPGGYEVILRAPDGGETSITMRLPATKRRLEALAARVPDAVIASSVMTRDGLFAGEQPIRQLGTLLFDALFGEGGRVMLAGSRHQAAKQSQQLRVILQIRPHELAWLPWEFIFDSRDEEYVCLRSPLFRYPLVHNPLVPMGVTPPLRILGMVAGPGDQDQLMADDEVERLESALSGLIRDGLIELGWVAGQTWEDLRDAMWRGPWHIFHFIGHGGVDPASQEGSLALADSDSNTYRLGADALAMMVADHFPLRLVVLNACDTDRGRVDSPFSSVARTLIRRGVPAVLAMQGKITDRAAVAFSRTFYKGLAGWLPVDLAVMHARRAVRLAIQGSLEWGTPVLYMHSTDGALFSPSTFSPSTFSPSTFSLATTVPELDTTAGSSGHIGVGTVDQAHGTGEAPAVGITSVANHRRSESVLRGSGAMLRAEPLEIAAIRAPDQVNAVSFATDGTRLAFGCDGRLALLIDQIGRECLRIRHGVNVMSVRDIQFDPAGGRRIATGAFRDAKIWDADSGDLLLTVGHADAVRAVAFSQDGQFLATGSTDKAARIWDASTGRRVIEFPHVSGVLDVAFSPDGKLLATASSAGSAQLWTVSGAAKAQAFPHDGTVRAVAFSPDGRFLVSGSTDGTARVWDIATGGRHLAAQHAGPVRAVAFSPDGSLLATGSTDGTARVWDIATGGQLLAAQHAGPVRAVAFSPDGSLLATGSEDRRVQLWQITKDTGQ